jgi:heat shock protein HslJ
VIRRGAIGLVLVSSLAAAAEDPPLMCFGNEPSWGLALETSATARLMLPDAEPAEYEGADTRIEFLRERVWRGKLRGGAGGELVAFLREDECSDGMSDLKHPVVARVSLPDGRFLAGCCRITSPRAPAPPASGTAPDPAAATLEGPVWRLVQLRGHDALTNAESPNAVTVRFEGGRLQGFGGCNQLVGSYSIDRDRVTVGQLAGTMMACPQPEMAVETALKDALAGALRFRVVEGRLTLASDSDADPRLVFEAAPPARLEGITWEVTGFNNGRHAVVGPLTGTSLTVSFQDGSVVGHSGCNSFRASYTREGNRLSVGATAATRKACAAKGVMEQEREFLAALESTTTWALDRSLLDLHRADGERVLFARESAK